MQRTNIYLEDRQTEALDKLAKVAGVSRAEMLRRMLDRGLAGEADALTADLAAIDLSFGCLGEVELDLPVRDPDVRDTYVRKTWNQP